MNVMMFRAKIKHENVDELETAAKTMFSAIEARQPEGVKYASSKLSDGETYVIVLALESPPENPLTAIPEFQAFQAGLRNWLAEPPSSDPLAVIGSYNLF